MFGQLSYLTYTILFGGVPTLVLFFFYRRLILSHLPSIAKTTMLFVFGVLIADRIPLELRIWVLPIEKRLPIEILSVPIDELIFALIMGLFVCVSAVIFLDLEQRKASLFTWIKTIGGISSLAIVTYTTMLLLRTAL